MIIKKFQDFLNEKYDNNNLTEMTFELEGLYEEESKLVVNAINLLRDYYDEDDFNEDVINYSMDILNVIVELGKVKGDKQKEAQKIINNIKQINARIDETNEEIGNYY
jgi:hypothetical protein